MCQNARIAVVAFFWLYHYHYFMNIIQAVKLIFISIFLSSSFSLAKEPILLQFHQEEQKRPHITSSVWDLILSNKNVNDILAKDVIEIEKLTHNPEKIHRLSIEIEQLAQEIPVLATHEGENAKEFEKLYAHYEDAYEYFKQFLEYSWDSLAAAERAQSLEKELRGHLTHDEHAKKQKLLKLTNFYKEIILEGDEDNAYLNLSDELRTQFEGFQEARWRIVGAKAQEFKYDLQNEPEKFQAAVEFVKRGKVFKRLLEDVLAERLRGQARTTLTEEQKKEVQLWKDDGYRDEQALLCVIDRDVGCYGVYADMAYGFEIEAYGNLVASLTPLIKWSHDGGKVSQDLLNKQNELAQKEAEKDKLEKELAAAEYLQNLYGYQSFTEAMTAVTEAIYKSVHNQEGIHSNHVIDLRKAFLAIMHGLETFEVELAVKYKQRTPFPETGVRNSIQAAVAYFHNSAQNRNLLSDVKTFFSNLKTNTYDAALKAWDNWMKQREEKNFAEKLQDVFNSLSTASAAVLPEQRLSKKQLMINYQLALNGYNGYFPAYWTKFQKLLSSVWNAGSPRKLAKYVKKENITALITLVKNTHGTIKNFAYQNPILAADLMRNITHTYQIMAMGEDKGTIEQILGTVSTVFKIKEAENMTKDWLLGSTDYFYSDAGLGDPIPIETLVLLDIAEKAPYLAGAYVGGSGVSKIANAASGLVEYVPIIGSWGPIKALTKVATGVAVVQAQKNFAEQMTREQELYGNMLRRGIEALYRTTDPREIAKEMAVYAAMRKTIKVIGTMNRVGLVEMLKDTAKCIARNPGATVGGSVVGATTSAAVGGLVLFTASASGAILIPIGVMGGCITGGAIAAADEFWDWYYPGRKEARELAAKSKQLSKVKLESFEADGFTQDEVKWVEEDLPKVIKKIQNDEGYQAKAKLSKSKEETEALLLDAVQKEYEEKEIKQALAVQGSMKIHGLSTGTGNAAVASQETKYLEDKLSGISRFVKLSPENWGSPEFYNRLSDVVRFAAASAGIGVTVAPNSCSSVAKTCTDAQNEIWCRIVQRVENLCSNVKDYNLDRSNINLETQLKKDLTFLISAVQTVPIREAEQGLVETSQYLNKINPNLMLRQ